MNDSRYDTRSLCRVGVVFGNLFQSIHSIYPIVSRLNHAAYYSDANFTFSGRAVIFGLYNRTAPCKENGDDCDC